MNEGQTFCSKANPEVKYTSIGSGDHSTVYGKAEDGTIVPFHQSEITEYPTKAAAGAAYWIAIKPPLAENGAKTEASGFLFEVGDTVKVPQYDGGKLKKLPYKIVDRFPKKQSDGSTAYFYWVLTTEDRNGSRLMYEQEELIKYGNKPASDSVPVAAKGIVVKGYPTNAEILKRKVEKYNQDSNPREGDFLKLPNGKYTRFTHNHGAKIQTGGMGGSYYFGEGYQSYSGGLDPGIKASEILLTDQKKKGLVWFFDQDMRGAGRDVHFEIEQRVYEPTENADLSGIWDMEKASCGTKLKYKKAEEGTLLSEMTEREFLDKYFGANVFANEEALYFEIRSKSISDDEKAEALIKELKAEGFTVKKKKHSDFTAIMGVKRKPAAARGEKIEEKAVKIYMLFGSFLNNGSLYAPYSKHNMEWTTNKEEAEKLFKNADIKYFDQKEVKENNSKGYTGVYVFELHKATISEQDWKSRKQFKEAGYDDENSYVTELIDFNYAHIKEKAFQYDGTPLTKEELEKEWDVFAKGGRIRDRKYTSSQPHEKRYTLKRKSRVIKYKKK